MGGRVVIDNRKHKLVECVAFVRERIPPEHRSCWSVYRRRRQGSPTMPFEWYYDWEFWFSKRYENLDFEMKLRFG